MNCPHCGKPISPDLAAKALRSIKSESRAKASRANGMKGGRPRKDKILVSEPKWLKKSPFIA